MAGIRYNWCFIFLSYILHSSFLLNVRHIGMLVVSGFAAQSFKDELYLVETGLEILSTQVISGAMWVIGSFSDLRMVFQEFSTAQGWVGRGELHEECKGADWGRRRIEFIVLEVKEGQFSGVMEWSFCQLLQRCLIKWRLKDVHCMWKFEFVGALSKREMLKKTGGRKAIYKKLRSKKLFYCYL